MRIDHRTLHVPLSGVTAFVVTVVALAPFVNSQALSISTGDRFWSIGTIGAGVLAVVAVGTAAAMARCRRRTAALTTIGGIAAALPGLYDHTFESLSPVGAGIALGAVAVLAAPRALATLIAGTLVAVHISHYLLDPGAVPRRYANYIAEDTNQFQPPLAIATVTALVLAALCAAAFWRPDPGAANTREVIAMRPVAIAAVLTLLGVAANWLIEITTVAAAAVPLLVAVIATVVSARVLGNGGRLLLMSTAAAACLATVSANRPATSAADWSSAPALTAALFVAIIVGASGVAAARPSVEIGYGALLLLTAAGLVNYVVAPDTGTVLSIGDLLVVVGAAAASYALTSAVKLEPPRTGASRSLVGLGVIFGPTALALLVYRQFDYGWTAYTPLDRNEPLRGVTMVDSVESTTDIVLLDCMALLIVIACASAALSFERRRRPGT